MAMHSEFRYWMINGWMIDAKPIAPPPPTRLRYSVEALTKDGVQIECHWFQSKTRAFKFARKTKAPIRPKQMTAGISAGAQPNA